MNKQPFFLKMRKENNGQQGRSETPSNQAFEWIKLLQ